jgi:MFS family permease
MIRNIVATIAGLIAGSILNMVIVQLNMHVLFPMPAGMDINNPEQLTTFMATLPASAFLVVMVAHLGQSFVGGWLAARLGASRPMLLAMIVGALSLVGGIMAMMMIKGPDWMMIELPLYLVVAWAAGRIEEGRRARLAG